MARSPSRVEHESGSVTAELVVVLPAVVLVLVLCVGAVHASVLQVRLQSAASAASRSLARGDGAEAAVRAIAPGAALSRRSAGDLVCVDVSAPLDRFTSIRLSASGCALSGGR